MAESGTLRQRTPWLSRIAAYIRHRVAFGLHQFPDAGSLLLG